MKNILQKITMFLKKSFENLQRKCFVFSLLHLFPVESCEQPDSMLRFFSKTFIGYRELPSH